MGLGVLCLETYWSDDALDRRHSRGLLEVIEHNVDDFLGVHRHVATRRDLERYLAEEWPRDVYDVLYIATHGDRGRLLDEHGDPITLRWLAKALESRCQDRVVMLGACEAMTVSNRDGAAFIERTGAAALVGYATKIDWIEAAQMELTLLGALAHRGPGATGVWHTSPDRIMDDLFREHEGFARRVGWEFFPGEPPADRPRRELADGARTALAELERIANDSSVAAGVRVRTLEALGALGDRWSLTTFSSIAREREAGVDVRLAAVHALSRLEGGTARASLVRLRDWLSNDGRPADPADEQVLTTVIQCLDGDRAGAA